MGNQNGKEEGQIYRDGYPNDEGNDPNLSLNLQFYQNKLRCEPDEMLVEEIHAKWRGRYQLLERKHGYVQWLFPIKAQGMNEVSQRLMRHEKQGIRADPQCQARFVESYSLFLDFLGINLVDKNLGTVERTNNYRERFHNLLTHGHNNLRITRVFKCLGELGFEHFQAPLINFFFHEVFVTETLADLADTIQNWWVHVILDDTLRTSLEAKMEKLRPTRQAAAPPSFMSYSQTIGKMDDDYNSQEEKEKEADWEDQDCEKN